VAAVQVAIAQRAFENGPACGDQAGHWQHSLKTTLCIADGLGHGPFAERAARGAVDYVAGHLADSLPLLFAGCDQAIRHTRGVALGVARVDEETGTLTYAGVGNTRAIIVRNGRVLLRLRSNHGIVGAGYGRLTPETVPLLPGDLVILFTDGLLVRTDVSSYDSAQRADVELLAERILQDWGREADDAALLVFRCEEA